MEKWLTSQCVSFRRNCAVVWILRNDCRTPARAGFLSNKGTPSTSHFPGAPWNPRPAKILFLFTQMPTGRQTLLSSGRVFTRLSQYLARNFVKCFTNSDALMREISSAYSSAVKLSISSPRGAIFASQFHAAPDLENSKDSALLISAAMKLPARNKSPASQP